MKLTGRLRRLEKGSAASGVCTWCHGECGPMAHVDFENGDEPVEFGWCPRCKGAGGARGKRLPKHYVLESRAAYDCL